MKNILVLVHDDDGQEARLQVALDVTRAVDGHLHCLDVTIFPLEISATDGGNTAAALLADEYGQECTNKARLEERLPHEDVPWDWVDACGSLTTCITDAASLADLIVVNRKLDSWPVPDMLNTAADLILRSRKPILAVPEDARGLNVCGHALVAWDGSQAATAAMRAAIPLLKFANAVTLLEIEDGAIETPAEEAAAYLSREDIHALIRREKAVKHSVADRLCAEARSGVFSYIVMGGYGHSRIREALFGGVTRQILSQSAVPVLLAH